MLTDLPICHNYKTVDKQALNELQQQVACVELKAKFLNYMLK